MYAGCQNVSSEFAGGCRLHPRQLSGAWLRVARSPRWISTRIMSDDLRSSCFASVTTSAKSSRESQMLRRVACGLTGRFAFFGRRGDRRGIRVH
jgi:hypothetical protein